MTKIVAASIAMAALSASPAMADFNRLTGEVDLSQAPYARSLEGPDTVGPHLGPPLTEENFHVARIQGRSALKMNAALPELGLDLTDADRGLVGRRVEVKLWYKPFGSGLGAELVWGSGSLRERLERRTGGAQFVARMSLAPTGRGTDDGWRELSTGPVDWALGGALAPQILTLKESQSHTSPSFSQQRQPDRQAQVLVDALEVVDLGPAEVW